MEFVGAWFRLWPGQEAMARLFPGNQLYGSAIDLARPTNNLFTPGLLGIGVDFGVQAVH
jgi:hypothetical protein